MKNIVKEAIKREKEIYAKKLEEKEAMEKVMVKAMEEARSINNELLKKVANLEAQLNNSKKD